MNLLDTKDTKAPAIISATKQQNQGIEKFIPVLNTQRNTQTKFSIYQNNMRINSSNFQCFQLIFNRFSAGTVSYKMHLTNIETSKYPEILL
jgi:hypothetical protein